MNDLTHPEPPNPPRADEPPAGAATPGGEVAFQLRGSSFSLLSLRVLDPEQGRLFPQLEEKLAQAPNFFRNAPVVLDLDALGADRTLHLPSLVRRLKALQLIPVAIQGGTPQHREAALTLGLPLVAGGRGLRAQEAPEAAPQPPPAPEPPKAPEPPPRAPTLYVTEPVRSGRQVYAPGGNLVVLAAVSPGAEVLADGDIHIYGALRGRALAGLAGDAAARIFCLSLEAEMVSIAGLYRVNEDIDPALHKKAAQIFMQDGFLCMGVI